MSVRTTESVAEQESRSLSIDVIESVADVRDLDPLELPQLRTAIDPDAFEQLFSHSSDRAGQVRLTFTYAGCEVAVDSDETVTVQRRADGRTGEE
ncbi:HalOD1 output domain-containing protein [Halobacteriaceae archaeon SHR40]|uniref:HalOD1 output domain-containing protein n=1 Tax=Halovenus amylolytica TaxID=2500550 RepID=UPI000FE2B447